MQGVGNCIYKIGHHPISQAPPTPDLLSGKRITLTQPDENGSTTVGYRPSNGQHSPINDSYNLEGISGLSLGDGFKYVDESLTVPGDVSQFYTLCNTYDINEEINNNPGVYNETVPIDTATH